MRYQGELVEGVLVRRYKRFLADVALPHGVVAAHVPNSGAMRGCSEPGSRCRVSHAASPRRRLAWTLEQVFAGPVAVGVNTLRANALALEALTTGVIALPGLDAGWQVRREVRLPSGSRIDLQLTDPRGPYWVEVKNVTWVEAGTALFPDAVTLRGARHVTELARRLGAGERAAIVYVVQRQDAVRLRAAAQVDAAFAAALATARAAGLVEVAVEVAVTAEGLAPHRPLPVVA